VSWNDHHSLSEKLAVEAEAARRAGEIPRAEDLYKYAALEEAAAFEDLADARQRTRGITAVSAVALAYKGRDYSSAAQLAYRYMGGKPLLQFAEVQLRDLLQIIWTAEAAEKAGVKFVTGDVLVSVKGGQVIYGGAPLDLIMQKVEGIQATLFRTVEMLLDRPFRKRGGPPADILSMFRPWLFQAPAGSYQFAVRMQEPPQMNFWKTNRPKIEHVTSTFFSVLRATSTNAEELTAIVPDVQYRGAFLNLSRNLAPTGKTFDRLEIRDASSPAEPFVTLGVTARQELNSALKKLKPPSTDEGKEIVVLHGILRGLHLDQDWLEVATAEQEKDIHISQTGDVLDDVVGPMVNRKIVVTALFTGSKYLYRDIELEE
jgi:hypothetical protein